MSALYYVAGDKLVTSNGTSFQSEVDGFIAGLDNLPPRLIANSHNAFLLSDCA
jgi:hypothetical protein